MAKRGNRSAGRDYPGARAAATLSTTQVTAALQQGLAFQRQGNLEQAEHVYRQLLTRSPQVHHAWHLLGLIRYQLGYTQEGLSLIQRAIELNPQDAAAHVNLGAAYNKLGRFEDALSSHDRALHIAPGNAEAHCKRGNALLGLDRGEDALASYQRARELSPSMIDAVVGCGLALRMLKRNAEALACLESALKSRPRDAELLYEIARTHARLKEFPRALESFDAALALRPDHAGAWRGKGNLLLELQQHNEALAAFQRGISLNASDSRLHYGCGRALAGLSNYPAALACYDQALGLRPAYSDALNGRGTALSRLGLRDEALVSFSRALELTPNAPGLLNNMANTLRDLNRHAESAACLEKLIEVAPENPYSRGFLYHERLHLCDWRHHGADTTRLTADVREGKRSAYPFVFISASSSACDQLECAKVYASDQLALRPPPVWQGERYHHDRIRVAYISADLHDNHPVAFLLAELLERHDRSRFEISAISLLPKDDSKVGRRLAAAFDHFADVSLTSDQQVAEMMRRMEIDIAVDLMGYTRLARPGILLHRPAPVQVAYLGYAGTTGTDFVDYLLADAMVVPDSHRQHYQERVVQLPGCFMPRDTTQPAAATPTSRREAGLPEQGFVFCCFNNAYKFNPPVFDVWMRLLRETPGSVLWLSQPGEKAAQNLKSEAQQRGIEPDRIVFAGRVPSHQDHLARMALADLFVDTLPYNAHTTASDALWMGLPVLTCMGEAFASRVAGSMLAAIGLPELVTTSLTAYEQMALKLANDPDLLSTLRNRLSQGTRQGSLFDMAGLCGHIESAYSIMLDRQRRGLPPESFAVEPGING